METEPGTEPTGAAQVSWVDIKNALDALTKTTSDLQSSILKHNEDIDNKKTEAETNGEIEALNELVGEQQKAIDKLSKEWEASKTAGAEPQPVSPDDEHAQLVAKHKELFLQYVQTGNGVEQMIEAQNAIDLHFANDSSDGPSVGWTIPTDIDTNITRLLRDNGAMMQVARVRETSAPLYQKPIRMTKTASGWVGEREPRPQTTVGDFADIEVGVDEIYAEPGVYQNALDDSSVNLEQMIAEEVATEFVEQADKAFINGDGVKKPRGLFTYPTVANANWKWGNIGFVTSEDDDGFPKVTSASKESPARGIISLIHSMKRGARANAKLMMNDMTLAMLRKMTDGNGNFIWQHSMEVGAPSRVFGYPVYIDDYMDDVAAGKFPIALVGEDAYLVLLRQGTRTLRDPYTAKPIILFYSTKRVGGGILNYQTVKFLKIAG